MEAEKKKKFPIRAVDYELYEIIGEGASASVHRARCVPLNEIVAIKITDCERDKTDLNNISQEAKTMLLVDHPNLLHAHCSFVDGHYLWVVMPYLAGGSCFHLMKWAFPKGFPEEGIIAFLLREALKGLEYLHQHGHIHRDVKAGNIIVDSNGRVKLGDFGVSASLFDSGDRQRTRNTFVGTPCWMAPEVVDSQRGYDFKADIWSFGITALELAHGHAPFSSQPPVKVFLMTLQNAPPSLDNKSDKKFSRSFKHMIAMCLVKDPSKRPSATKLLKQQFFKQAKSQEYVARKILQGLPSLGERFHALKLKDEELLSQKKMHDLEEKKSKSEYHLGISNWNFDIKDLKSEASLISEIDDIIQGKDSEGCSNCFCETSSPRQATLARTFSLKDDGDRENNAIMLKKPATHASQDLSAKLHRTLSLTASTGGTVSGPSSQYIQKNGTNFHGNCRGNHSSENGSGFREKHMDNVLTTGWPEHNVSLNSCEQGVLRSPRERQHDHFLEASSSARPETSRLNGEARKLTVAVLDEEPKLPVVQQKGRFKVTSENVDKEKALSSNGSPSNQNCQSIAAKERERELRANIADLKSRLHSANDELHKLQAETSQANAVPFPLPSA